MGLISRMLLKTRGGGKNLPVAGVWILKFDELWTTNPPDMVLKFDEHWTPEDFMGLLLFPETWTTNPPDMALKFSELWSE